LKPLPKIILLFAAVDLPIYMRMPMVYALAESAKERGSVVVAVNRPLCPFSTAFRKPKRTGELFGKPRLEKLADNLYSYCPRYFIHDQIANSVPFIENLNNMALRRSYTHLQKRLNITEPAPLIWFNYPHQGYVRHLFPDSFCIMEIYDNLADNLGNESPAVNAMEEKMRDRVDLLMTTSHKLHDKYAHNYRRSFMFGNGLTRQTYERLSDFDLEAKQEILNIPSPRLGYAGMISDRLDWKLISGLAALEPSWNFVFAGHMADPQIPERMKRFPNIRFLGEYSHAEVPSVLKAFDIGLLPYLDNPFFHFLNPLKFYELAAAGLASISSNIEELKHFPEDVVRVVPSEAEVWGDTLRIMLAADAVVAKKAGPDSVNKFIWEDMTSALLDRISGEWLLNCNDG
jgi:hypothetical protein